MIGRSMEMRERFSDEALRNVADGQRWVRSQLFDITGAACLLGHAFRRYPCYDKVLEAWEGPVEYGGETWDLAVAGRFDTIARQRGIETARVLVQNRARRILARRSLEAMKRTENTPHTSDSAVQKQVAHA